MFGKLKVLVVDDEEMTLVLLVNILRGMNCQVYSTMDPLEGVALAHRERPDIILLDIFMPVRNGWSVLSQIRSEEALRKTPIIILTSDDHVKSVELAYELGVASYLTKPVNPDLLKMKVTEAMAASND